MDLEARAVLLTKYQDVMTESLVPKEKSKEQLEQLIKTNGGQIYQTHNTVPGIICIGEKREPHYLLLIFG